VSLIGDIALGPDEKPSLHPHVVVSLSNGSAMGGHLLEAHVRPTLEVVITESPNICENAKMRKPVWLSSIVSGALLPFFDRCPDGG
jgi:predicted DNA-binding protein with PD1-like motif